MKLSMHQRLGNGDILNLQIEPQDPTGKLKIHSVKLERTEVECGKKQIARFFLSTEHLVEEFLVMMFGGELAAPFNPEVTEAWHNNKLSEVLNG